MASLVMASPDRGWGGAGSFAVVAERAVALADGLAEADRLRAGDEVGAFLAVAGDAVEDGAQPARGGRVVLMVGDGVERPRDHLELVGRDHRDALGERHRVLGQFGVGHDIEHDAHGQRLGRR